MKHIKVFEEISKETKELNKLLRKYKLKRYFIWKYDLLNHSTQYLVFKIMNSPAPDVLYRYHVVLFKVEKILIYTDGAKEYQKSGIEYTLRLDNIKQRTIFQSNTLIGCQRQISIIIQQDKLKVNPQTVG